ncbi:substrate-binding domain-containing protein [Corynebacterium lujinxingii]|uniref:Substrate-binding domain-containing protein n=1 Tax=Corynebacterium lujinxingii TaxID=2763010 RepID=A0A7H0JZJ3_9CORY|nr:substrate-binding domain-containing protein [Corynebacterium lujinxingii]MBC3179633.1 substrate-binding domain-containing protein [Corynebacterium lujinxingii]NNO10325.1 substrate-binding domain-containing protein [Corynebacterium lujinxingii]QNP90459.1 substrate-binding domain-containing protein [Corynebacterium lujinxingii]
MKKSRKAAVSALCLVAAVLGGCSSTGGAPRSEGGGATAGGVDTPRYVVAMVTHGAPGDTYWDLVRKGAEDAAKKDNIELRYSSDPQAPNQANFIRSAVDAGVDGIAVTMPNAEAIGPAAQNAVNHGIPVVGLNAGMTAYQDYGMTGFFGQDETVAGRAAGERLKDEGNKRVLCVVHEQGNSSQEARCAGVREGLGGEVDLLYVNGQDLTSVQSTITSKLSQDRGFDTVFALQAPVAMRAVESVQQSGSEAQVATFDTNAELVDAISDGRVAWAVDQQPYLQGYLAVDSLWLAKRNGATLGGGRPVYTGPSFVDQTNVDTIEEAAKAGMR